MLPCQIPASAGLLRALGWKGALRAAGRNVAVPSAAQGPPARPGLCQRLTACIVKGFSLKSSLNLHSSSLKPFPCALSQQILLRSRSLSSLQPLWVLAGHSQLSPEPSLLQPALNP